jgi:hypothetical protein
MYYKLKYVFTVILLMTDLLCSLGQGKNHIPEYHLYVHLNPAESSIIGTVIIMNPGDSAFLLTESMNIIKVTSDGREVAFFRKPSNNSENSMEVSLSGKLPKKLVIEYTGQIFPGSYPKTISDLNMINSRLVELSDYIDWYPRAKNNSSFLYKLDVEVPSGFKTIANGFLKNEKSTGSFNLTHWESDAAVYGITLVSAPDLWKSEYTGNGMKVEIYYSRLPVSYVDSMKVGLLKTMNLLSGIFGCPASHNLVRVIYSPRSAGGYARAPLILVSENYALEQINQKFGSARDFRLNAHEIAHYWSRADAGTSDDWINEGLAEYSALLVSEKIIGKEFSDLMLNEYNEIVNNTPTEYSIVETPADSRDREVNRYYKPTLLLNNLKQKYGEEKMKEFLRSLYKGFTEANKANTPLFLDILEKNFGKGTKDSFAAALYMKTWETNSNVPGIFYSLADTAFTGTWTGPLTQFGATIKFVLNLNFKDGKFVPSLDSPDQNVTAIPLSDLEINNDSISFKIGVAAAGYKGRLDRNSMIIRGEFTQRGGNYTLNLSKEKNK